MINDSTKLRHDAATAWCLGVRRFDGGTSDGGCVGHVVYRRTSSACPISATVYAFL